MDNAGLIMAAASYWYGDPVAIMGALARAQAMRPERRIVAAAEVPDALVDIDDETGMPTVARIANGIAMVRIAGPMMAGAYWGATDTSAVTRLVRAAAASPDVSGIMLDIDSPGGEVGGVSILADEVRAARRMKPVAAHVSGMGASAGYHVAAQASIVTAERSAKVGGIGVYTLVGDVSKMLADEGIKIHLVTSGGLKGQGAPGVPVSEDYLADTQRLVGEYYDDFVAGIAEGRGWDDDRARSLDQGVLWSAHTAFELGVIDGVLSRGEALAQLHQRSQQASRARVMAAATAARARLSI
jgi:signal peptide peptidase SppA